MERRERKRERKEREREQGRSTEPTRLSGYAICRQATLLHIGSILLSLSVLLSPSLSLLPSLFLSSTRPSSFLRAAVSFSPSPCPHLPFWPPSLARGAVLVRSRSRSPLCAASGLLVPLCSRSFVQYSVRERGRGGWLKAGGREVGRSGGRGQGERSGGGSGGSLARANPTDSRNTIPPLVGGLRMVRSHDRNQPGRRRERAEGEEEEKEREDPGLRR